MVSEVNALVKELESELAQANATADDKQFEIDEIQQEIDNYEALGEELEEEEEDELDDLHQELESKKNELDHAMRQQSDLKARINELGRNGTDKEPEVVPEPEPEPVPEQTPSEVALEKLQAKMEKDQAKAKDLERKIFLEKSETELTEMYNLIVGRVWGSRLFLTETGDLALYSVDSDDTHLATFHSIAFMRDILKKYFDVDDDVIDTFVITARMRGVHPGPAKPKAKAKSSPKKKGTSSRANGKAMERTVELYKDGHTQAEIRDLLEDEGISISDSSVWRYVTKARKQGLIE